MLNTFGLQNWRVFQTASQQSSQQSHQLTEMIPLQRLESECPPNISTGTYKNISQFNLERLRACQILLRRNGYVIFPL